MAILRAGPWSDGTQPMNPVDPVTLAVPASPVNIARGNWPNQTWAARSVTQIDDPDSFGLIIEEWGTAALGETVSVTSDFYLADVTLSFHYQATASFQITVYFTAENFDDFPASYFGWQYTTKDQSGSDQWFDTGGTSTRTQIVTLPATTFGSFYAYTQVYYPSGGTATVKIS